MTHRHIAGVGGVDCVGIGSDFDGISGNLEICDCAKVCLLEGAAVQGRQLIENGTKR